MGYRLGVDLGTTFTAAAVDDGTGPTMLGLGNRALTVPSVVYLSPDGTWLFAEAADRRAASEPSRSAREFKRRIGDTVPILVAGQPFSPQALSAKLLAWVVSVATERQGAAPDEVVVTYPANWGGYKRELLTQLVSLADVSPAVSCTEPEAAATQYASRARLTSGDKVAVYDLGGGTFDVCLLEKHETGFAIIGSPDGVEHLGGIDFDEAVFQHVVGMLADRMADLDPDDPLVTDALARLRRECVEAKEALSSDVEATISVALPGITTSLRMTRTELEGLITSPLRDTLDATQRALRSANLTAADLATVVLVGGSSRIPLVSHLLQSEFGVRTAMDTHPKHDIALGAVQYHLAPSGEAAPPAAPTVAQWPTRGKKTPEPSRPAAPPPAPTPTMPAPDVPDPEPTAPLPVQPVEKKPPGPPVWKPPDTQDVPGPTGLSTTQRSGRLARRPVLVGIAAAVALLVVGASTYALTRDETSPAASDDTSGPGPTDSTTTDAAPATVYPKNVLLIALAEDASSAHELHAIDTTTGDDLGPVSPGAGPTEAAWVSRLGDIVGFRDAPPGTGSEGPWTIKEMSADGTVVPLFSRPPEDFQCSLRVAWHPTEDQVLLNCLHDDGNGKFETSLYTGPVGEDGRVDGTQLELLLSKDSPTADSPNGSPGSYLRSVSYLPSGLVAVSYDRGEEPGIHLVGPDGSSQRLTSGEHDEYPVASPVDELIAFVRDGDLYVASSDPDGPAPPCPGQREPVRDGETGTPLCNLTGDRTSAPDQAVFDPSWSWDGKTIAFLIGTEDLRTLHLIDLETANGLQDVISEPRYLSGVAWGPR
jgi:actin-like ATPase involved in cell morphogenesis